MSSAATVWPALEYSRWRDTATTLQLWTQIVGKVRLALTPWLNHGWHVALYVTSRGLGTSPIPAGTETFEIDFDFVAHELLVRTSTGTARALPLAPQTVAEFHDRLIALLHGIGFEVKINGMPNEVADPIPFRQDRLHAAYDSD